MCGIAGWYRRGGAAVQPHVVERQCDAIRHRGPDDTGVFVDGDFGFGMRRLSIIDIAGGQQPVASADGRIVLVFNGEIYNHAELRRELEAAGRTFATRSDTEVILVAYLHWGDRAWERLVGMFAVAIWDRDTRVLRLARDPLGIKPLYLAEQAGGLAFASELKALRALGELRFDIDPRAVHDFFCFGHVRGPRSIYAGVRTLPPGHLLTIGPDGDQAVSCFWQARTVAAEHRHDPDWIEEFRRCWLATVDAHLVADVEVGVFLSGGIDSSAIAAAASRLRTRPVKAFTIGFPVARFDESEHAAAVARHLGCEHIHQILEPHAATDVLPAIARCYDEPFADPAAVPTWYLSRMAAEHVKVVLSGDGGDELFAGYKRHANEQRMCRNRRLVAVAGAVGRVLDHLPAAQRGALGRLRQRVERLDETAGLPDAISRFFSKTQITSPGLRARLYDPSFRRVFDPPGSILQLRDEYFPDPAALPTDPLDQFLHADLTVNLPAAMLTKVDRASMAHSLEVRTPFLAHDFVDWALGVPLSLKHRNGVGKYIVREAVRPWLPAGILDRGKQGFQLPLQQWFAGDFGAHAQSLWRDSGAADAGFLDAAAVEQLFQEHRSGGRDHGRILYALAMFALWWTDRPKAPRTSET